MTYVSLVPQSASLIINPSRYIYNMYQLRATGAVVLGVLSRCATVQINSKVEKQSEKVENICRYHTL